SLLAAFLLPWVTTAFTASRKLSFPGVNSSAITLAAAGVCLLVGAWLRSSRAAYLAGGIAVLTGGAPPAVRADYPLAHRPRMAVGLAPGLLAWTAFFRRPERPAVPTLVGALTAGAAGVFVVSLFLPWQQLCVPGGDSFGQGLGRCIATTGWSGAEPGAVVGTL